MHGPGVRVAIWRFASEENGDCPARARSGGVVARGVRSYLRFLDEYAASAVAMKIMMTATVSKVH
jgi:hypothetical protein